MKTNKIHVTESNYWSFNRQKELKFVNKFLLFIKEIIESLFKIKISRKISKINHFEISSFPINLKIINERNVLLTEEIKTFIKPLNFKLNDKKIQNLINRHDYIFYKKNPIKNNSGGIGYNNSIFLYIFNYLINVDLIIESGVWQGYTTYIFDQQFKKKKKNLL